MTDFLIQLISKGGLPAILITMAAESGGVPISSEIVVPLGGYLAQKGVLSFAGVVLAATLGNLFGSLAAFWLTRRYGTVAVLRHGHRLGLRQGHLDIAERFFARFGLAAVFLGRLLPVVRTYISFPAGLSQMSVGSFSLMTVLGALPWNFGLAYAGLKLGEHYGLVEQYLHPFVIPLAVLAVVGLLAAYLYGRRRESR